jgi:hypothetical protein
MEVLSFAIGGEKQHQGQNLLSHKGRKGQKEESNPEGTKEK